MSYNSVYPDSCLQSECLQLWAPPNLTQRSLRYFLYLLKLMFPVCRERRHAAFCKLWLVTVFASASKHLALEAGRTQWLITQLLRSEMGWNQDLPFVPLPIPDDFQSPGGKHCAKSRGSDWSSSWLHSLRGSSISSGNTANLMDRAPGKDRQENLLPKNGLLRKDKKQSTYFFQPEKVPGAF